MAFPLAHPAAVLPLRRFCPRWLSFPALVIGSVIPDAGYLFQTAEVDLFSHKPLGILAFCLPAGILALLAFYALRTPLVKVLPEPYRRALLPVCHGPRAPLLGMVVSLLIGACTHLLWDSCTHKDGWFVQHIPLFQATMFTVGHRAARVCLLLWYVSSFAGLIWLFLAFEKWKQARVEGSAGFSGKEVLRDAVLVALLLLPIAIAHHLLRESGLAVFLVAAVCIVPAIAIMLRLRNARGAAITSPPVAEGRDSA